MLDKIIDFLLDETKDKYFFMSSHEKLTELNEVKKRDEIFASLFYMVLFVTWVVMGFTMWLQVSATLMSTDAGMLEGFLDAIPFVIFSVALFMEVAALRTNSRMSLFIYLATNVLAVIINPLFTFCIIWFIIYLPTWCKFQAMREQPGYPTFSSAESDCSQYSLTERQRTAYESKKWRDMDDPDKKLQNSENLDKILNGEMSLDDYLEVEKYAPSLGNDD
ncbi:MAG: hypothetical protein J6A55_06745 [Oscillospiraceae bacterium]|nr:hypothetical protein [Oscillospiraceae bacterium]